MAISPETIQLLVDAGLEGDALMRVVRSIAADNPEKQRSANAIRQARFRERQRLDNATNNVTDNVTNNATGNVTPRAHVEDNLLTKEISGQVKKKSTRDDLREFEAELRPMLDDERIQALVDVRRKKGGKLNGHSARLLKAKILECGLSPADAADKMALRNWISIERSWIERDNPAPRATAPPNGRRTYADVAMDKFSGGKNGTESIFGTDRDVELIPPDKRQSGPDDGDIRGGIAGHIGPGRH